MSLGDMVCAFHDLILTRQVTQRLGESSGLQTGRRARWDSFGGAVVGITILICVRPSTPGR